MEPKTLQAILVLLTPQVITLIMAQCGWDEAYAAERFYASKVYAGLEQEETKLWHLGPMSLFQMFMEEEQTGGFTFPEEV